VSDPPRSYYGRPVIKEPVWTWEVPVYFFAGGTAGASAPLALVAGWVGNRRLAQRAWAVALAGAAASPVLLVSDLGRPERFLNMLRLVKPTSPMSLGSWVLAAFGSCTGVAAGHALLGRFPGRGPSAQAGAGALGPVLATYTAVLVANTAVPAWHEARRELPFVFAGSALASAGAAAAALTPPRDAAPARRAAVLGAGLELGAAARMERRLGSLAGPYRTGGAARYAKAARGLTAAGAGLLAAAGRRRAPAVLGGLAVLAGSAMERWAVFEAGRESARDPAYTVGPQRARVAATAAG
jgi:DMSO reductase anchor subunit